LTVSKTITSAAFYQCGIGRRSGIGISIEKGGAAGEFAGQVLYEHMLHTVDAGEVYSQEGRLAAGEDIGAAQAAFASRLK